MADDTPHILLTSLGVNARETTYQWQDGRTAKAPLTPLALVQLLERPRRPNLVVSRSSMNGVVARAKQWLLGADEVTANVTGGTTLMGLTVQKLVEAAGKLDRPVHRFALIDRRSPDQQNKDPFVQGDCHWIDDKGGLS